MIGWCASAAVGSEPPEDFSSRCCSSPSSYLFYFSSSNATRNCHLFAFICTRPRRHGYIDNLTSVADTCRPAAAVLSANQLIYDIQSSSAAAAAAVECKNLISDNQRSSKLKESCPFWLLRRSNNTIERACLGTITTKQTWINMELWRNEMEEEINRIISIESFPTLHLLCVRKGGGEILMHIWIQSDRSLRSWKHHSLLNVARQYLNLLYRNRRPTLIERKEDALIDCQEKFDDGTNIDSMWL